MIIFLYTDKKYEYQAINTIKSLEGKVSDDTKIVYYTVGFKSNFEFPNLHKIEYPVNPAYPRFNFYKAELSLRTMELFPNEDYIFTDSDVIFSKRFNPKNLVHDLEYPLASFGPLEYVLLWAWNPGEQMIKYSEAELMKYFNVSERSQRYVFSCFYVFNSKCKDFFEEFMSICNNQYLLKQDKGFKYFPFSDEGAFNVCLWKRNATQNLGFSFVNTHLASTVNLVENTDIKDLRTKNATDELGIDWEYINDSSKIIFYHGLKDEQSMIDSLQYVTGDTNIIIVNAYINDSKKEEIMYESLTQLKKYNTKVLCISNSPLSDRIIKLCDYAIQNNDNILLPKERTPIKWFADNEESIHLYTTGNSLAITKNLYTSLKFVSDKGFKNFIFMEFDSIIHDEDFIRLDNIFKMLKDKKAFFCRLPYPDVVGYESRIHGGQINFFLNKISLPFTYELWTTTHPYASSTETLEYILPLVFTDYQDDIHFFEGTNAEYFTKSKIDLCSSTQEINIVYNTENQNKPLLFLVGTNAEYLVQINDTSESIYLSQGDTKKYKLDIEYNDCNIKVTKNKEEPKVFNLNMSNIEQYKPHATRFKL